MRLLSEAIYCSFTAAAGAALLRSRLCPDHSVTWPDEADRDVSDWVADTEFKRLAPIHLGI